LEVPGGRITQKQKILDLLSVIILVVLLLLAFGLARMSRDRPLTPISWPR